MPHSQGVENRFIKGKKKSIISGNSCKVYRWKAKFRAKHNIPIVFWLSSLHLVYFGAFSYSGHQENIIFSVEEQFPNPVLWVLPLYLTKLSRGINLMLLFFTFKLYLSLQ